MSLSVSNRVERVKPSPTLVVSNRAKELKAQGKDILDLSTGEPDFDTPEFIKEAAIKALHEGFTKYTAFDGTPGLKKAIVNKFARENQLTYEPNQILVSCGAKHSLYNLFQALINPGDEVVIPAPYWVSYPDMVLLADGLPVIVHTDMSQRFKMAPHQLESAITAKTRAVVLNSPSNPSGIAYTKEELAGIAKIILRHPRIVVVTDDIYEHILWTKQPFVNILNVCPELTDRTVVVNGVSKSYAMTGWRIGYAAGPVALINGMKKVQSQSTTNPTSISQVAAEAGLNGDQSFIKTMLKEFKKRHDYIFEQVNAIPGLKLLEGDGTFYAFIQVEEAMKAGGMKTDLEFTEYLLNHAGIAAVPGSAFGTQGYIRISYATSMEVLKKAVERMKNAVENIGKVKVGEAC